MVLRGDVDHDVISIPSHAGDGAAEGTCPWRDVDVELCWRWCYRGDVDYSAMSMLSHGDGAAESC
jgi:hypothetical protein